MSLSKIRNSYNKFNIKYVSVNILIEDDNKKILPVASWKNLKTISLCNDAFNKKSSGLAIITGKISNITVLDFDSSSSFEEVKDLIPDNSPIVNTKKGKHVYFSYCDKLKNNSNKFNIKDIDCRNDGGIIIGPLSQYKDKSFQYTFDKFDGDVSKNFELFNKLPEIPKNLLDLLIKDKIKKDIKPMKYNINVMNKTTSDRLLYIEDLLNDMPTECFEGYENWRNIGWGIAHFCSKDIRALSLFRLFSMKIPEKYDEEACKKIWDSNDLDREDPITIKKVEKIKRQFKIKKMDTDRIDKDIIMEMIEEGMLDDVRQYINRHFVVINGQDKVLWVERVYENNKVVEYIIIKSSVDLIEKMPRNISIEITSGKYIPIMSYWNNWEYRKQFNKIVFKPGIVNKDELNLFTGFNFEKDCDFDVELDKINKIIFHCKEVICNGDEDVYEYMLDILAWILQNPSKRLGVAILCKSIQGVGKNLFFENFFGEKIIGRHAICVADPDQVVGKFNSNMEGKVYSVVNELKQEGNFQKNSSLLKSLITDKTNKIERKGIDAVNIENYNNFVFLTNNHNVLSVEPDDRRYLCLEASSKYKRRKNYFDELVDNMNDENAEHFYHFLMNRDVKDMRHRTIPTTTYKRELMMASTNSVIKFMNEFIKEEDIDVNDAPDEYIRYNKDELYSRYKNYTEDNGTPKFNKNNFNIHLMNDDKGVKMKIVIDNKRRYYEFNWLEVIEDMKDKNILFR